MHAKCGSLESAQRVFQDMPRKNEASWNAMISALASHDKAKEAFHHCLLEQLHNTILLILST
ncbi:Tetratricopeptide-like helical domain superfamily [Sesbania bispinosa]|nr:Tetratricopeptide-like helical domain superfamily [Sesbania bispinosa]